MFKADNSLVAPVLAHDSSLWVRSNSIKYSLVSFFFFFLLYFL